MFQSQEDFEKFENAQKMGRRVEISKKVIDMSHVTQVCFHYDRNAPVKSKKLFAGNNDESRFDIYTPTRTFMMKADEGEISESVSWVAALQETVTFFS